MDEFNEDDDEPMPLSSSLAEADKKVAKSLGSDSLRLARRTPDKPAVLAPKVDEGWQFVESKVKKLRQTRTSGPKGIKNSQPDSKCFVGKKLRTRRTLPFMNENFSQRTIVMKPRKKRSAK